MRPSRNPLAQFCCGTKFPERADDFSWTERVEIKAAVAEDLRHRAASRTGDRQAGCHRFQQNVRQILAARRENEGVGRVVEGRQVRVHDGADPFQELAPRVELSNRAIQTTRCGSVVIADKLDRDWQAFTPQLGDRVGDVPLMFVDIDDRCIEDAKRFGGRESVSGRWGRGGLKNGPATPCGMMVVLPARGPVVPRTVFAANSERKMTPSADRKLPFCSAEECEPSEHARGAVTQCFRQLKRQHVSRHCDDRVEAVRAKAAGCEKQVAVRSGPGAGAFLSSKRAPTRPIRREQHYSLSPAKVVARGGLMCLASPKPSHVQDRRPGRRRAPTERPGA